jgi:hypothetical protein
MEKAKSNPHIAPASAKVSKVDFKDASSAPSKNTKLVKKKSAKTADPAIKDAGHRSHVTADGHRAGARYGIKVGFAKQTSPEAGATQGNGRIIPPAINRSKPNFSAGMSE